MKRDEPFSFYGVLTDGSVGAWDFLKCANELIAAEHAMAVVANTPGLEAVEVWSVGRLSFCVQADFKPEHTR